MDSTGLRQSPSPYCGNQGPVYTVINSINGEYALQTGMNKHCKQGRIRTVSRGEYALQTGANMHYKQG